MPFELNHQLKLTQDRDTIARQSFIAQLRGYILNDMATAMRRSFEQDVVPEFVRANGRAPATEDEVHEAMRSNSAFKFYSSIRCNAQEMVWRSVMPAVVRELPRIEADIGALSGTGGGTLELNPDLPLPENVAGLEAHLMPGGYAPTDSPMAGAVYDNGLTVFSAGFMGRNLDDIGLSMSNYVKYKFPEFEPGRILDCGTTVGHNAAVWARTFPDAQVHAIDVSAAMLKYAHGRAESLRLPVHFKQMDATELAYPAESFDVVFSSMFLHELSLKDIARFLSQARRVLRPGGLLLTMELPPNRELAPYDQFYLDWDAYYNGEPFYRTFRDQDPASLLEASGFAKANYFQFVVPQFSYMPKDEFVEAVRAPYVVNNETGRLSSAVKWFGFGTWKR